MKDPKGSYNNDAFDELLRQFMLEESANDKALADKLDEEAQRIFAEEPLHKPDPAREKALIAELDQKLRGGSGGAGPSSGTNKWFYWGSAMLIVLVGLTVVLQMNNKDVEALKPVVETPLELASNTVKSTESPIVLSLSNGVDQLNAAGTEPVEVANFKEDQIDLLPIISKPISNNKQTGSGTEVSLKKELLRQLDRKLTEFEKLMPEERVYVHTDRNFYLPGNTIWLAAYLRNGSDLTLNTSSEVLYLELVSDNGEIVSASRVVIVDGKVSSSMILDKRISGGEYMLRAFTLWEAQKQNGYIFEKPIYVQSINKKTASSQGNVTASIQTPELEIYPEGGYSIVGIEGRVAVALSDKANTEAKLLDSDGDALLSFNINDGKGLFRFTPEDGEEYKIQVGGRKYDYPYVLPTGITISTDLPQRNRMNVTLHAQRKENVLLVGMVRGKIYYAEELNIAAGETEVEVPLGKMPAGVLQLSLFDNKGVGHAERLVFINGHKKLNIELNTAKASYQPREQVDVTVKVTDEKGRPVETDLSMAVVDDQLYKYTGADKNNIVGEMLLGAELDRYVDDPSKYLNGDPEDLDLLLMTSGWRRFSLPEVYYSKYDVPTVGAEVRTFSGTVVDGSTGDPLKGVEIRSKFNGIRTTTDKDGKFMINDVELAAPIELDLSYKVGIMNYYVNRYQKDMRIEFFGDNRTVFQPAETDMPHPVISGEESLPKGSFAVVGQVVNSLGQAVPKATVKAEGPKSVLHYAVSDDKGFYTLILPKEGNYDVWAENVGYRASVSSPLSIGENDVVLLDILMDRVDVNMEFTAGKYPLISEEYMLGRYNMLSNPFEAKYLEPNATDDEGNELLTVDRNTIYYMDGYKLEYGKAVNVPYQQIADRDWFANGVAAKYENNDNEVDPLDKAGSKMLQLELYTKNKRPDNFKQMYEQQREYPNISYTYRDRISKDRTDLRATLYWNGSLITNKQGEASFSFFTSDDVTTLRIVGQGISEDGLPGVGEMITTTSMPYMVSANVPELAAVGTKLSVALSCDNLAGMQMTGKWKFDVPGSVEPIWPLADDFTMFPMRNDTLIVNFNVVGPVGIDTMTISFESNGYEHSVSKVLNIRPEGSDSAILQP